MTNTEWSQKLFILDAHCDSLILRHHREDAVDLSVANTIYQVDLPRLRTGGVNCLFCMVGDSDLYDSSELIDAVYEMCNKHPEDFVLCLNASEVRKAYRENKIAIVLTIEGQKMFNENLSHLRNWHRMGVRVASITHGSGERPQLQFDDSYFDYISPQERENLRRQSKGLTPFGWETLKEMTRLKITADLAHINDTAYWEVLETDTPVCYTHGCCYRLCPHSRGLTDEMMKALAERKGVMGIAFYKVFIHPDEPDLDHLCDHFIHALSVMGPDYVGIGSDFDGTPRHQVPEPADVSQMDRLFDALSKRGVDEETLIKIAGGNFLRLIDV